MHSLARSAFVLGLLSSLVQAQGVALPLQDELRSPSAAYALFGLHPGGGGIEIATDGPVPEIFLNGTDIFTPFWHVLRHDGVHGGYADRFVSPVIGCGSGCVLSCAGTSCRARASRSRCCTTTTWTGAAWCKSPTRRMDGCSSSSRPARRSTTPRPRTCKGTDCSSS